MTMKATRRTLGSWIREFRTGSALLLVYGIALAGSDPGWATWAGAMAAGVLVMETPPPMPLTPSELFSGAGTLAALGLFAFAVLPLIPGASALRRWSASRERASAWRGDGGVPGKPWPAADGDATAR